MIKDRFNQMFTLIHWNVTIVFIIIPILQIGKQISEDLKEHALVTQLVQN